MKIINSLIFKVILFVAVQQTCLLPAFSQSKKDQIETLILQKDSLSQTLSKERKLSETYKVQQEQLITTLEIKLKEIELKLLQANQAINDKNKELKGLQNEIKTLTDSINLLNEKLEITLNENLENSLEDRPIFDNSSFNGVEISFPKFLIGKKTNRSLCSIYDSQGDIGFYMREDGHVYISGDHWGGKIVKTLFAESQESIIIIHDVYNGEEYMGLGNHQLFFNKEGQLFELISNEKKKLYFCNDGNEFIYKFKLTDFVK
jgi:hypothetical protein